MNLSNYPKPQSLLRQDSVCGITWRGYLTRAALLAVGFGGYVLLTKKIDLSKNGKRCFYALRKYFPRGKNDVAGEDRRPVCLGGSKTEKGGPCGHFLCTNCLTRQTKSQLLMVGPDPQDSIAVNECRNRTPRKFYGEPDPISPISPIPPISPSSYLSATNCWYEALNYLVRNLPAWSILSAVVFVAIKFQVIPWWEFIGYESISDFLMPLVVMPTIYIWFMYREKRFSLQTIRRE